MLIADGGGGGSFADIMNLGAIQGVTAETQKLVDAAKGGGFKITPEGVKPLTTALLALIDDLDALTTKTYVLNQSPQLGNHPYGHTIAAHDQKGAAQAEGSATVVLDQLKQVARQANEALKRAAGLYNESENAALGGLTPKS